MKGAKHTRWDVKYNVISISSYGDDVHIKEQKMTTYTCVDADC